MSQQSGPLVLDRVMELRCKSLQLGLERVGRGRTQSTGVNLQSDCGSALDHRAGAYVTPSVMNAATDAAATSSAMFLATSYSET
jgi:hypothetical protein